MLGQEGFMLEIIVIGGFLIIVLIFDITEILVSGAFLIAGVIFDTTEILVPGQFVGIDVIIISHRQRGAAETLS